ncbi:MAG: TrbI/VirB10 family protein [Bacilli bacterium]
MGIENIQKPEISKNLKTNVIVCAVVVVALILVFALVNAFVRIESKKEEVPKQEEVKQEAQITDAMTGSGSGNYFEKNKPKDNNQNSQEKPVLQEQQPQQVINYNNGIDTSELMRAYYSKLIQDEEQARSSQIGFNTGTSNKGTSLNNSNGNNSNNNYQENGYPNQYQDQNMQTNKIDFANNAKKNNFYNSYQEETPLSKYEVMAGTFIPATLITGINSDLPSNSVAIVRENVYDSVTGNYLLIPKGTKIIGKYDSGVSFGQDRLLIVWQRLIYPNGKYIGLDNMGGVDLSGYAGFTGKVNNHFFKLLQAVVLSSAMGAGSAIVSDNGEDDWRTEAGKGAGNVILDFGNKMGEKILNRQPTIEIKQGYRFNIMVQSDLILTPYRGQ